MDTLKAFYEKYKIYLTRHNLELLTVTVIVISAIVAFTSGIPSQGALTLDKGAIKYNGSLVRGKMSGQGTLTFKNGDVYKGHFKNGFLRRRFYRIVPPLVFMILIVMPFTLLIRKDFVAGIGTQIAAALGFVTNFYEILSGGNYESQFIQHLFVHTWSLALEMHYYILWA